MAEKLSKDDAANLSLYYSLKGNAVIRRRDDGILVMLYPGQFGDWHVCESAAQAFHKLDEWCKKEKKSCKYTLINVEEHELRAH